MKKNIIGEKNYNGENTEYIFYRKEWEGNRYYVEYVPKDGTFYACVPSVGQPECVDEKTLLRAIGVIDGWLAE